MRYTTLSLALVALGNCGSNSYRTASPALEARELTISLTTGLPPASGKVEMGAQGERTVSAVKLTARLGAWRGGEDICQRVTPVAMAIENRGDQPLRIRYDTFELETETGARLAALPPFALRYSTSGASVALAQRYGSALELRQVGFSVATPYQPLYPGLASYPGPACAPSHYYLTHAPYWRQQGAPSDEMRRRALPEGVLGSGGRASGFLYFEKVPPETKVLILSYQLEDPRADVQFGSLSMTLRPPAEVLMADSTYGPELRDAQPIRRRRAGRGTGRSGRSHRHQRD